MKLSRKFSFTESKLYLSRKKIVDLRRTARRNASRLEDPFINNNNCTKRTTKPTSQPPLHFSVEELDDFLFGLPLRVKCQSEWINNAEKDFPLIIRQFEITEVLKVWLQRLQPDQIKSNAKETNRFVMTSAPAGAGKTHFFGIAV